MAETLNELLVSLIDSFNKAWVRPARWNENQVDDMSVRLRELWGHERDKWVANLLELIKTALLWPEDGEDVDLDANPNALPSWRQNIERFKTNCAHSAEVIEMQILTLLEGDENS